MTDTDHTNLEAFKINGSSPFSSYGDGSDQALAQAHAILTLMAGAEDLCEEVGPDASDAYDNIRHGITARALEGVAALVALAQHQNDVSRCQRQEKARRKPKEGGA